ncbi:MAG: sulfatase-like hydrolase/transferase, partial [Halobacteria archaeon]
TLVVITSDHGEGFGEESEIRDVKSSGHGSGGGQEEGVLHVPLLVKYPDQTEGKHVKEPSSLSRFPTAVLNAVEGDWRCDDFVPKGQVVSYMPGLTGVSAERAKNYLDDISEFQSSGKVVYEEKDGKLIKYVDWNGKTATLDCTDPRSPEVISDTDDGKVEEVFGSLEKKDVRERDEMDIGTDEVKNRLKDLGYA